jgi:subtilisin family serine protease
MPVGARLLTVVSVIAMGLLPVPAHASAARAPATEFAGAVTLVTGDHVTVRRAGTRLVPQVSPAAGREHVHFAVTQVGDSLLVVPSDAWAAVRAGRVDQRLFDVAALLRDGFGDARSADIPVIVESSSTMDAFTVSKEGAASFWQGRSGRVWLDGIRRPSLDVSVPQIHAPAAWEAGFTGAGVPVAVLDTGIDDTHPDLRRQVVARKNFTSEPGTRDTDGHGTHVASTIAGTGAAAGGRYRGVAPGARLLIGKVCAGSGCAESAILAGMEWAAAAGAKVVNLSLGGPDTAGDDPLELAIERLSARYGTLFVVAAGNDGGYGAETVSSPASADAALAVGAVDDRDVPAGFSARGPRVHDAALKPEIVAPGVDITAARSRFSDRGGRGDRYVALSGTSMATPHVAGSAAILAQRHPDWSGARLKAALVGSAEPLGGPGVYEQGAGRVDAGRAVSTDVVAEPAAVSAGRQSWPHEDDQVVTRTVTYRNVGAAPRNLSLTAPDGPAGMFRLSAHDLVVPAGGQASVEVTVDTAVPAGEGTFGGNIVAAGSGIRVVTPVAVDREPESYDLTLRTIDGGGRPTDDAYAFVFGLDQARFRPVPGVGGAGTLRVLAGRYHVDAAISTPRPDGLFDSAKVAHPVVDVHADTTVVLDARATRPVSVTFDRPGVRPQAVAVAYTRFTPGSELTTGVLGDTFERITIGQVGPPADLITSLGGVWAVPDPAGDVLRSAVTYNLAWFDHGVLPTGFRRHVVDRDLAQVRATYRAQADGKRGTKVWVAREPVAGVANGFGFGFRLPLRRTEFHNVEDLAWSGELQQWSVRDGQVHTETVTTGGVVDQAPGQVTSESWNTAVVGPGLTGDGEFAARYGDTLAVNLPLYADAGLDRSGVSEVDGGSTVLYRDGVKVGETAQPGVGQWDVPPDQANYRLEVDSRRSAVSSFSTRITGVWTFPSARPPDSKGKGGTALSLMAVRFAPPGLDLRNTTSAGTLRIPVTVQFNAPGTTLAALSVDASFDDGRTWAPVPVSLADPGVTVTHPRGTRYVSLRATAADSAGSTVTQTIIRAYRASR